MSGLVLLDKYNKLPTTAWYICWLHSSSTFSPTKNLISGFTGLVCQQTLNYSYQIAAEYSQYMLVNQMTPVIEFWMTFFLRKWWSGSRSISNIQLNSFFVSISLPSLLPFRKISSTYTATRKISQRRRERGFKRFRRTPFKPEFNSYPAS